MNFWLYMCVIALIFSICASIGVRVLFSKNNKRAATSGLTAAQIARDMLDKHGLYGVQVIQGAGTLTDNYDPRNDVVTLSESVYDKATIGAISVAAHEVGHAIQHAERYAPVQMRTALFPVVSFCSKFWYIAFVAGLILEMMGLVYAAIALFGFVVLFQLVTLPVEFDASKRALDAIAANGYLMNYEMEGARETLIAAAFTYVAALLASIMQLLRLMSSARR